MDPVRKFYSVPKACQPNGDDVAQITPYLIPKLGGKMLDIGCYDGEKTVRYKAATQTEIVWGVEFSADRLMEAEKRGILPINADLNSDLPLDFPPASFDVIICSEVIEHVFSPDSLLDEIARLLSPGGYAILTTPNLASWKNRIALMLGWQPFATEVSTRDRYGNPFVVRGYPVGHIRIFTLSALLEMLHVAGLRPVQVKGLSLTSPQNNMVGSLSRVGDALFTQIPALADRFVLRLEKA